MATSDKMLVYHYRHNGQPAVKDGLAVITQKQLDDILESNPDLQASTKAIPRGAMSVDIHQCDLLPIAQRASTTQYPNSEANVAGVRIPLGVWLGSTFAGEYSDLVILSKRTS
ncbi:hypothetical protein LTR08_000327 [Meristemomyces frigidus]|nr:hypothetical protein LTR08_000327 [Meristemomyces frigidus]